MNVVVTKSYDESCAYVADMICRLVNEKPDCKLGLATGGTPVPMYKKLIEANKAGKVDFSKVRTVNLDEYCGLSGDNPQSYRYFMEKHLFSQVNLPQGSTHLPNGTAPDMEAEARRYEALVESLGYADLQLLGIGHNGHIGFNEPCDSFPAAVHPVELTESTIQANSRLFDRVEDVPTRAITMGIGTILKARRILLIAGADKREIVEKALTGPITPWVPASVLQLHRDVTVITCGE